MKKNTTASGEFEARPVFAWAFPNSEHNPARAVNDRPYGKLSETDKHKLDL